MPENNPSQSSVWSDALSDRVIDLRKQWLNLTDEDIELVKEIDPLIAENIDPLIADMYDHFLSFEQTRVFFPDEATLKRAQAAQKRYFLQLCKGVYDRDYVNERLAVGNTHYRIGLDPTWYLGAYNRVMGWCRTLVRQKCGDDHERYFQTIGALTRLIFFDMGLAIEAYSIAKETAIRRQRDAINELETERRVTRHILEDAPVGIIRLDESLHLVDANSEFLEIIDRPNAQELEGKALSDVVPFIDQTIFEQVATSGVPYRRNADFINLTPIAAAPPTYFDWAVWPVKDSAGDIYGLVAIFTDVTNRVLLQQQREDFVATLTHDLKTPILAANRAIRLLMDGDFGSVEESQKRILETICQSNDAMYKMVQTLLDVYRYDSGVKTLSLAQTNLVEMVEQMLAELRPLASSRGIELQADLPDRAISVVCDVAEIRRVVQNLLDNAMKFTASGGTILIKVVQDRNKTQISVNDTGKGISDEDRPKLFQRFWAAASSGRYYASTGLGLYLCRKIVELHGGRIWVDSTLGKGSTFYFTVPNVAP